LSIFTNSVSEFVEQDHAHVQDHHLENILDLGGIKVQRIQGKLDRPWSNATRVRSGQMCIKLNLSGSILIRDLQNFKQYLAPSQSVIFIKGPADIPEDLSRGNYDHYLITWNSSLTSGLVQWLDAHAAKAGKTPPSLPLYIGSGLMPHIIRVKDRVIKVSNHYADVAEPIILGALHELVTFAYTSKSEISLTSLNVEIPSYLSALLKKVKKNPGQSWSLKEASALAGYSPFHLSRTFKASIGYGFPEFVDRCRVERAIQYLLVGGYSIDRVASVCGYSSTHGLREAMKQYIGFLPSELRAYSNIHVDSEIEQQSA
jgi:AraC-like DNA-binding protein